MAKAEAQPEPEQGKQEKARRCLDNMLAHFREFGGIWEVTARSIKDELQHFNAWGAHDEGESWQDVTLYDLRTAYLQHIKEREQIDYMTVTTAYREDRFFGTVIDEAIAGAEELERLTRLGKQAGAGVEAMDGKPKQLR